MKKIYLKKTLNKQLGFVLFLSIFTFSCQNFNDDAAVVIPKQNNVVISNDLSIKNGRLVFKDENSFKRVMTDLQKNPVDKLDDWERKIGFYSLRQKFNDLMNKDQDAEENFKKFDLPLVPDSRFASILDPDGVYQIGDKIIKTTNKKQYSFKANQEVILKTKDFKQPGVEERDIVQKVITKETSNKNARPNDNFWGWISGDKYFSDTDYRMAYEIWNVTYINYASIGARIKTQRERWWGGWWQTDSDYIQVYAQSTYALITSCPPAFYVPGANSQQDSAENASEREVVLDSSFVVGCGASFDVTYMWAFFEARRGSETIYGSIFQ